MSTLSELLNNKMQEYGDNLDRLVEKLGELKPPQIEGYLSGKSFPTKRNGAIDRVAGYLGMEVAELQRLKPKSKAGRKPSGPGKRGRPAVQKPVLPTMAKLHVFGQTVEFATVDELGAYLNGERGEISIEVMGRKLVFNSVGEVSDWISQFESLFKRD